MKNSCPFPYQRDHTTRRRSRLQTQLGGYQGQGQALKLGGCQETGVNAVLRTLPSKFNSSQSSCAVISSQLSEYQRNVSWLTRSPKSCPRRHCPTHMVSSFMCSWMKIRQGEESQKMFRWDFVNSRAGRPQLNYAFDLKLIRDTDREEKEERTKQDHCSRPTA